MSAEVKEYLHTRGVATSHTTPYNPQGNGQVERLNSTLWRTIQLALKTKDLPIEDWEDVLPQALHSIRSLLCTSTNCTPHERMFAYSRRSANGDSIPTWLTSSGKVLMRRNVRQNKYQPLVEEVEVLHANPTYSHVRLQDGRETTVSNSHLAPLGKISEHNREQEEPSDDQLRPANEILQSPSPDLPSLSSPSLSLPPHLILQPVSQPNEPAVEEPNPRSPSPERADVEPAAESAVPEQPRRSSRVRTTPRYLVDYIQPPGRMS